MEQLRRTRRFLSRLHYAYEGIQDSTPLFNPEDVRDDVLSLFMHCYHVKDWIKASTSLSENLKNGVEHYVNENQELRICADLANGSKHYKITREYRSGTAQELAMLEHEPLTYRTGTGGVVIHRFEFSVKSEQGTLDALKLAKRCVELWQIYLDGAGV